MEATLVSISCPSCGAKYRIPESISAKKVSCKKCGSAIFLRLQGAFREKNGSAAAPRKPTTARYARLKGGKPVKTNALHYVSALVTVVLLVVFVKMVLF